MQSKEVKPGMIVFWRGHGRVYVERMPADVTYAVVRFDADEGMRSVEHTAPIAELQVTKDGWRP